MKITPLLASLASLASLVLLANAQDAQAPLLQKQVVVTYPSSTPKSIIDDAISRISAEVRRAAAQQDFDFLSKHTYSVLVATRKLMYGL